MSETPGIPGSEPEQGPGYWEQQAAQQQGYGKQGQGYGPPAAYGSGPYGPGPYGAVPYGYGAPKHPSATTALVLGIVSLSVGMMCGVGFVMAPFAWFFGAKAVREIDAAQGQLSGRSEANAGKIMGIVGTVLLALAATALVLYVVFVFAILGPAFV